VPLLQHFVSYDGPDVKMTAARLIAIEYSPICFSSESTLTALLNRFTLTPFLCHSTVTRHTV
jgi:hypothetical protein